MCMQYINMYTVYLQCSQRGKGQVHEITLFTYSTCISTLRILVNSTLWWEIRMKLCRKFPSTLSTKQILFHSNFTTDCTNCCVEGYCMDTCMKWALAWNGHLQSSYMSKLEVGTYTKWVFAKGSMVSGFSVVDSLICSLYGPRKPQYSHKCNHETAQLHVHVCF